MAKVGLAHVILALAAVTALWYLFDAPTHYHGVLTTTDRLTMALFIYVIADAGWVCGAYHRERDLNRSARQHG